MQKLHKLSTINYASVKISSISVRASSSPLSLSSCPPEIGQTNNFT